MSTFTRAALRITFAEDSEFHGLVIRARRPSIQQLIDWNARIAGDPEGDSGSSIAERTARLREVASQNIELLAELLIEWNYVDERGVPVPTTVDGIWGACDPQFIGTALREIMKANAGVSAPLDESSPSGVPFPEVSIPMETS